MIPNLSFTGGAATAQGGSAGGSGFGSFLNEAPFVVTGSGAANQTSTPTLTSTPTQTTGEGGGMGQMLWIVVALIAVAAVIAIMPSRR